MSIISSNGPWYDFQPGNGTRYKIFSLQTVADDGYDVVVCWLKNQDMGGPTFRFRQGGHIDLHYFMEKTGITNPHDASAILLFCSIKYDFVMYGIPEDVRQRDWWRKHL